MGRANPLRWDCDSKGCFNLKKRPKIELFAECLPGNMAFGDIDGIAELNGNFLLLEWKQSISGDIGRGQAIMYERMASNPAWHVFVIVGDPETMKIERYAVFHSGKMSRWKPANIDDVKERIRGWVRWAG